MRGSCRRPQHGRDHASSVGNTLRHVARSQGHRYAKLELAVVVAHGLQKPDLDGDFLSRRDIGDRGREQIGPLLFDKTGLLPGSKRLLVGLPCLLAFLYLALDTAVVDLHRELVDGSIVRQREGIDPLDPVVTRIDEGEPSLAR